MSQEIIVLITAAASIGFFHTLLGPDHYLPFIMMTKTGKWSLRKTALVTILCGAGHVLSSVLLGFVGVALGIAVSELISIESVRGNMAAWGLIAFGLVYFVWGIRKAIRNKPHTHFHSHAEGHKHAHKHMHTEKHSHLHKEGKSMTPWVLFVIFVLGPCEPLIPLLMYPAAKDSTMGLILVTGVFSAVTIVTMLGVVLISTMGLNFIPTKKLERYTHALAGITIFLSGMAIQFLGL